MKRTKFQQKRLRNARRAGFTLIELMVVLMIITLFSTMIVPSIASAMRRGGIDRTAEQLQGMVEFARMSAITRHQRVVLNIDPNRGRCWVSIIQPVLPWLEDQQEPRPLRLSEMNLPEDIFIEVIYADTAAPESGAFDRWKTITFRGDGSTDDATIELGDSEGRRIELQVHGVTGAAYIEEPRP